jgi:hypothetical protein
MPRFVFGVHKEWHSKIGFDAASLEEAQELYRQVEEGEISDEELPNFYEKCYSTDTTMFELEEVVVS